MRTGARQHCCSAYLTFVGVLARPGADGRPARPLLKVAPTLAQHTAIFEAAQQCALHPLLCTQNCPSRHSDCASVVHVQCEPHASAGSPHTLWTALDQMHACRMLRIEL